MSRCYEGHSLLERALEDAEPFNPWLQYEARKRALAAEPLTASEYEARILEIAEEVGV